MRYTRWYDQSNHSSIKEIKRLIFNSVKDRIASMDEYNDNAYDEAYPCQGYQ
jgi:hypothetical protein